MPNKSGATPQVLSLPKGGGALAGIGETFSPDLQTGTGNFSVPLALPPGRNGFQPQLSLGYSTGNPNGPFGLGWGLTIPGITRKTQKGLPHYDDASDTFVLSRAEDLVPVTTPSQGMTRYRPRTEGLFARIEHHRDDTEDYWEVRSKDGLMSRYGTRRSIGADPAAVADPDPERPGRVFAWKLTSTTDTFGNQIVYAYERDVVRSDGPHQWDQVYLSEIRYVDFGDPTSPQFLVSVKLAYEPRPDPFSDYRLGFEVRTARRCTRIEIWTHTGIDTLARTYHLDYLDQHGLSSSELPRNGVSLLSRVRVEGHDGASSEWLPPLEFGYTRFEPEQRRYEPLTAVGNAVPERSLSHREYELVDLFANGLPCVLQMNGAVRYWRNLGSGRFDLPRTMQEAPAGVQLDSPGVQIADMNGNGRADLLVTDGLRGGYFPLTSDGTWDRRGFVRYDHVPTVGLQDPELKLMDLDGDGVVDALRTGTSFQLFFNDPDTGWERIEVRQRHSAENFPDVTFTDPRVKLGDMTGDGLQDIVMVASGRVDYWPYLGEGRWGRRISMRNSPRFEDASAYGSVGYDPRRLLVGDVDGDGCADLVYVGSGHITLWLNQSGNSWSDGISIRGTPPVSDMDAVRLVDMRGNGTPGILWTYDAGAQRDSTYKFLDLTGGIKPYLLDRMDNHMGVVTRIGYAPSTQFYLYDAQKPETRWRTTLPFPVQVVARVEALDAISGGKRTSEYRYHHGYWDGAEHEFRGFGRVDQRDTEIFEDYSGPGMHPPTAPFNSVSAQTFSPPTETRTWFHLGPVGDEHALWEEMDLSAEYWPDDPQALPRPDAITDVLNALPRRARRDAVRSLRGRKLRCELYALDGSVLQERPYTVTEHLTGTREEAPPDSSEDGRAHIFFPHPIAERVTQWERGSEPLTWVSFTGGYDAYGRAGSQAHVAVPRYRDFRAAAGQSEPYLATETLTSYATRDDAQRYLVDRVARTTSYQIVNDGHLPLLMLQESIATGGVPPGSRRMVGQQLHFYDGPAFEGFGSGQVGDRGALVRSESLVLTTDILNEAYKTGDTVLSPAEQPPYLRESGSPTWTPDYPQEFQLSLSPGAGYTYQSGGTGSAYEAGYFVATERRRYDFHDNPTGQGRGLVTARRDPLGHDSQVPADRHETTVTHDTYELLPTRVTDAVGLQTLATYDYRLLQPNQVTDPNGNRTAFEYTPLGMLRSIAVMGKPGEAVGDTASQPGTVFTYDLSALDARRQPISVQTVRRVHHASDTAVPLPRRDETIAAIEYSDGYGRLVQKRLQAEDVTFGDPVFGGAVLPADQQVVPGDAVGQIAATGVATVVVSGSQTYDNKGRVIRTYEPFFGTGWAYAPPATAQLGQSLTLHYDPRGQLVRTVNPDGSEQRVIHGVPGGAAALDLSNPDVFEPTPWESFSYDRNDNAGRTHPGAAISYQRHWNTPGSAVVDALGRTVRTTERNGPDAAADRFVTRSTYDILCNLLTVVDPLGRVTLRYVYDLAKRLLRTEQLDGGVRRTILDAAGNLVEQRDSRGALLLNTYDALNRPARLWRRDQDGGALSLRGRLVFGDAADSGLTTSQAASANLLGKLYKQYDSAGLVSFNGYDFKANVVEKERQVISDANLLRPFQPAPIDWHVEPFHVDWQPPIGTPLDAHARGLLDADVYQTSLRYDALKRVETIRYPQDADGTRKELHPSYNRAGALERVDLDGKTYVQRIEYSAKGQRTLIAYGNGILTRFAYDAQTSRLARLRTERASMPSTLTYHPIGGLLQDLAYEYDLAGNVMGIQDRTPGSGVRNNPDAAQVQDSQLGQLIAAGDGLVRRFTYDPLYRLGSASGRECTSIQSPRPWSDDARCGFGSGAHGTPNQDNAPDLTSIYGEEYRYDPCGNLVSLTHRSDGGSWTRRFGVGEETPDEWSQQWPTHLGNAALWSNPPGNRLTHVDDGTPLPQTHRFDLSGNLIQETTSRYFEWDCSGHMVVFRTQAGTAEPSVYAAYLYDAAGQRVKKLVRKQGGLSEATTYIDGAFERYRWTDGGSVKENNRLNVLDGQSRVATVRVGTKHPDDYAPDIQFHVGDHLASSSVVVDDSGAWVNREEYFPYGETSFGSFAKKRYRFTGKERDEESGLNYHGARHR